MSDKLILNPMLFVAVCEAIDADNPKAVEAGLAHIHISIAEGFSPEILSNVPPEAMDQIMDWLVATRNNREVGALVIGNPGPDDSDTIQ